MKSIKSAIAGRLRQVLPLDSRPRRFLAGANQGARAAKAAFVGVVNKPYQSGGNLAEVSYASWLRDHQAQRIAQGHPVQHDTRVTVFIERSESSASSVSLSRKTEASVRAQECIAASVRIVDRGSVIDLRADETLGDFVLFLKAGSVLERFALADIARAFRQNPTNELVVFDSDVHRNGGKREQPRFRPMWSPEMLFGFNYIGRAFALSSHTLMRRDSLRLDDRGVWELLLTAQFTALTAGNVSRVLLSESESAPIALTDEDSRMVASAAKEAGHAVKTSVHNNVVRMRFLKESWPRVSIVVPTRHSRQNLARLLPSLETTDYADFNVCIIDNGGESEQNHDWYEQNRGSLDLKVTWWEKPFNYSEVNNVAARSTDGEILLFLNDDTEIVDPQWLTEIVGMLSVDGVGTVGCQHLQAEGLIQHGGVLLGTGGFADNLFSGMPPNSETLIGSTNWYRDSLAVTGACVAISREHFEEVGGFDERFLLTGSDVVLGLDQVIRGRRNVVIPFDMVRHFESLTRGTAVPYEDFFASYWRYHPWLQGGDPYSSPNVSRHSAIPRLRDDREPLPVQLALKTLGRNFGKVAQSSSISEEASHLLGTASVSSRVVRDVHANHHKNFEPMKVSSVNWYIPDIDMPFFGGLNTAFRLADKLARENGVENRFVVFSSPNEIYVRSALAAAFPSLASAEIVFYDGSDHQIAEIPHADAAVATLWLTAMHVAKTEGVKRKFYLMQDYEPGFYPASSMFAMAEESYKLGLYGICNTPSMHKIYTEEYGGKATYFTPAVDRTIYNPNGRRDKADHEPVTIFAYARDHFRNCWELVYAALSEIKRRHGDGVKIVAAGARYLPDSADFVDLGLLDYRATGALYRETDIGLTMQISRHPSYLPLELMASGVPMVAPDSPWFSWLFTDGGNSKLTMRTLDDIVDNLDALVKDADLRRQLSHGALQTIDSNHSDWDEALSGVFDYMCNPEA